MNKRNKGFMLRLNEYELSVLDANVAKTGYSREAYIRSLIKGVVPNEMPPIEYQKLMGALKSIGNNMNQIAAKAHVLNVIDAESYNKNIQSLYGLIMEIQKAVYCQR